MVEHPLTRQPSKGGGRIGGDELLGEWAQKGGESAIGTEGLSVVSETLTCKRCMYSLRGPAHCPHHPVPGNGKSFIVIFRWSVVG